MFFALKMANLLRITPDVEDLGMDLSKHGGSAYTFHQQGGVSSQDPLDVSKVRPRCAANPDAVCPRASVEPWRCSHLITAFRHPLPD